MSNALMAGASRFAHLAGFVRTKRAADDDDAPQEGAKKRAADEDEDPVDDGEDKSKRSKRAADEDEDPVDDGEDKSKRSRRAKKAAAEEDDPDEDKDEEDDEDEPEGRRARRAKRAAGDDDDESEMRGKSAAAAARRRERARCAAIFASPHAAANPALAASLAFETTMTRAEAITVLQSQPRGRPGASAERAAANPALGPGGRASGPSGATGIQASWSRAFARQGVKQADAPLLRP